MLAGPSAGPSGPQIYIDGFTAGTMPPKQSIREIRISQNPFSAESDKIGFGRVEVFTKPGSHRFRGQGWNRFWQSCGHRLQSVPDRSDSPGLSAGDHDRQFQWASFFLDRQGRITDETPFSNYTQLDSSLNPSTVSTAPITPSSRYSFSPRLDFALTPNQDRFASELTWNAGPPGWRSPDALHIRNPTYQESNVSSPGPRWADTRGAQRTKRIH